MRKSERGFHVLAVLIGVNLDGAVVSAHNELSHPVARDVKVVETLDRPVLPLALHRPLHLWSLPKGTRTPSLNLYAVQGRYFRVMQKEGTIMHPLWGFAFACYLFGQYYVCTL